MLEVTRGQGRPGLLGAGTKEEEEGEEEGKDLTLGSDKLPA